ncbi:hypothetical protein TNCV_3262821 [Trichonephila clavipes]|nr:hypothetical protein TNCV_3262821 [Trichonephila clavipes]
MSSFLVLREGDNRNRWRDGQVCPDVGQGIMAPWARRLGCVLSCEKSLQDQRAAKCPEEALWSFTSMRSRCRSSQADVTFRHPLLVFRCSSARCFQTRITVELFLYSRAPIAR